MCIFLYPVFLIHNEFPRTGGMHHPRRHRIPSPTKDSPLAEKNSESYPTGDYKELRAIDQEPETPPEAETQFLA
jgi:hypothetical protein